MLTLDDTATVPFKTISPEFSVEYLQWDTTQQPKCPRCGYCAACGRDDLPKEPTTPGNGHTEKPNT